MISGILNVLKVPGMTSQDVVNVIRGIYKTKKVGHGGTLDPEAAGVLPVFIGDATKLLEYVLEDKKCYRAEATLGMETDTGDDTGKVISTMPVPNITADILTPVLQKFLGQQTQIPPMYSAIKIKGKKLYQYAREGKEIAREPRTIFIHELSLVNLEADKFTLNIVCSKGTYIRTLLEDISKALQTCATMSFLLRVQVGPYKLSDASTLEEIAAAPVEKLLALETAVAHITRLNVNSLQAYRITCGVKTTVIGSGDGIRTLSCQEYFLGIVEVNQDRVQALKIIAKPDFKPEGH